MEGSCTTVHNPSSRHIMSQSSGNRKAYSGNVRRQGESGNWHNNTITHYKKYIHVVEMVTRTFDFSVRYSPFQELKHNQFTQTYLVPYKKRLVKY
jgi:hypothetical protein